MTDTPKKYSDGPLIIPNGTVIGEEGHQTTIDTFIAAPLPQIERRPQVGDTVNYWPNARLPRGPAGNLQIDFPEEPLRAQIAAVHSERLVDLFVTDCTDEQRQVALVPLVHYGDPDPASPCGRCEWPR